MKKGLTRLLCLLFLLLMIGMIFAPQVKSKESGPYIKVESEKIQKVRLKAWNSEGIPAGEYLMIPFDFTNAQNVTCERTVIAIKQAQCVIVWTKPGTSYNKTEIINNIKLSDASVQDRNSRKTEIRFVFLDRYTKVYNPKEPNIGPYYICTNGIYMPKDKISHYCYGCKPKCKPSCTPPGKPTCTPSGKPTCTPKCTTTPTPTTPPPTTITPTATPTTPPSTTVTPTATPTTPPPTTVTPTTTPPTTVTPTTTPPTTITPTEKPTVTPTATVTPTETPTTPETPTITATPTPTSTHPPTGDAAIGGYVFAAVISLAGGASLYKNKRRK